MKGNSKNNNRRMFKLRVIQGVIVGLDCVKVRGRNQFSGSLKTDIFSKTKLNKNLCCSNKSIVISSNCFLLLGWLVFKTDRKVLIEFIVSTEKKEVQKRFLGTCIFLKKQKRKINNLPI